MRFSRYKRFWIPYTYDEFMAAAAQIVRIVHATRPKAQIEILTCEDVRTYQYVHVSFMIDGIDDELKNRRSYSLKSFTEAAWRRSLDVQLTVRDHTREGSFMIIASIDRQRAANTLRFYAQDVDFAIALGLTAQFTSANFWIGIGDGYAPPTAFNMKVGEAVTGIRLGK